MCDVCDVDVCDMCDVCDVCVCVCRSLDVPLKRCGQPSEEVVSLIVRQVPCVFVCVCVYVYVCLCV